MELVNFINKVREHNTMILNVDDAEIKHWNNEYGIPRNHVLEAFRNLKYIAEDFNNPALNNGFFNALVAECNIIDNTIKANKFADYFRCTEIRASDSYEHTISSSTKVYIVNSVQYAEELMKSEHDDERYIMLIDTNIITKKVNSNTHVVVIKNYYGIGQILYIIKNCIDTQSISLYFNDQFILFCTKKQLNHIEGVELFFTNTYQLKYLKKFVGMDVHNKVNVTIDYSEKIWLSDVLIYNKLKGYKNPKLEGKIRIGFYNYLGDVNVDYLNSPHCWVGKHFCDAIKNFCIYARNENLFPECCNSDNVDAFDIIIFWDFPPYDDEILIKALAYGKKIILYATESVGINMGNENSVNPILFEKIATWRNNEYQNKKIFTIPPVYFEAINNVKRESFQNRKKIVFIGSIFMNNPSSYSLYKEREKFILWMEENHLGELDFYGKNNRKTKNNFKSYKGYVNNKHEILAKYRYCICFENNNGYEGYVSEKIYDCIMARCVPIYLGAPDIQKHVPKDCFIDMREFNDYEELYRYLESIQEDDWKKYIDAMEEFEKSLQYHYYDGKSMFNHLNSMIKDI